MFLFNRKSPEEKEAARLEKLRRTEGDRAFGGAIMTPVSSLSLADICMVRLVPEAQALQINFRRKSGSIPYAALRGMTTSSEAQIARNESPITASEMAALLSGDAGQFVGDLDKNAEARARWFIAIDYADEAGAPQRLVFIAYSMRGPYIARSKLYAATQFEETLNDIMQRFSAAGQSS